VLTTEGLPPVIFEQQPQWTDSDEAALQVLLKKKAGREANLALQLSFHDAMARFSALGIASYVGSESLELPDNLLRETILKPVSSVLAPQAEILAFPVLPYLAHLGVAAPPEVAAISRDYSVYLLSYGADVEARMGEQIRKVELHLSYPQGERYLTLELSPTTEVEELARGHVDLRVGVTPRLSVEVPKVHLHPGMAIGGGVEASLDAGFAFHWRYRALNATIVAWGRRNPYARWKVTKPEAAVMGLEVKALLRAPKGAREVPIKVDGWLAVRHWWKDWRRIRNVRVTSKEPLLVQLHP
jgi:hypothetical protein